MLLGMSFSRLISMVVIIAIIIYACALIIDTAEVGSSDDDVLLTERNSEVTALKGRLENALRKIEALEAKVANCT